MNLSSHCGSCVVAIGVLAGPAFGQEVLFELKGTSIPNPVEYGAVVGDWNGDGIDDLALMWRYDDTIATDAGAVRIHSGKDGSVLHTWFGAAKEDYFGIPIAMPDLDGDGVSDVLVSNPWSDFAGKDSGSVFLFGSASATQLWRVDGTRFLAIEAAPVHDLDADGIPDILVTELGAVHLLSGPTGSLLFSITGSGSEEFGVTAAVLGDVNGDGTDDFLVGAPEHNGAGFFRGEATIYSGADQSVLHTFAGTTDLEQLGEDCAALDDFDGDGQRDFAVLARHEDQLGGKYDPVVRVYSGATNLLLAEVRNPDPKRYFLFPRIEVTGDVSGDGVGDFTLLAGTTDSAGNGIWAPLLYSGRTLSLLYSFEHLDPNGVVFASAGDFDRDGRGDMLAGTQSNGGRVRVYGGSDLWMNATSHDPKTGRRLELVTREGVAGNLVVLVVVAADGVPSFAVVNGLGSFDAAGSRSVAGGVPPSLAGHDLSFKSYADGASGRLIESAVETITFR